MNILKIKRSDLKFNSNVGKMKYSYYKIIEDLPILIDTKKNVLLGNSIRFFSRNEIWCIMIDVSKFDCLDYFVEIEKTMINEFKENKYHELKKEIFNFRKTFNEKEYEFTELLSKQREDRLITDGNYIEPPAYNFDKHSKKKEEEEELYYADLFSGY